jgi:hypothetical protein
MKRRGSAPGSPAPRCPHREDSCHAGWRLAECLGHAGIAEATLSLPHRAAALPDRNGANARPLAGSPKYSFPVRPQQIATLRFATASPVAGTEFQERLLAIGEWLKVNRDSIYGTTHGPLQELAFGRTTQKGKTVYLYVFDWPEGKWQLDGGRTLGFTQRAGRLGIQVPDAAPDPVATVLALKLK